MPDCRIALAGSEALAAVLQGEGFTVRPIGDVAALGDALPDVAVVDLSRADGISLVRRLKAEPETAPLPVLAIGAAATPADARLDADPPAPSLVAVIRGLSRAHSAERRLKTLARQWRSTFDAIRDGIALIDLDGRVMRCNQALAHLVGYSPSELIGRDSAALLESFCGNSSPDAFTRLKSTRHRETDELRLGRRIFQETLDPVFGEDGELKGAVRILSEITDRKRLEQELRDRAQDLTEAVRAKDEFLATVSHELRTPLHAILGWIGILRSTARAGQNARRRALNTIERNARAQARLVEDLLDVSRIIAGKLRLDVRPIPLTPSIEAAIESLQPAAAAKGIRLHFTRDRKASRILGDPDRLQQVAWNLVANAVKFTPAESPSKTIEGAQRPSDRRGRPEADRAIEVALSHDGTHARLTVRDHGCGISPDFLPHVFDPFRQADGTSTRRHGGLGLGLAIVRHLVEMHGGQVEAQSAGEGTGATFIANFPLLSAAQPERDVTSGFA